jgi:hypothetical protein
MAQTKQYFESPEWKKQQQQFNELMQKQGAEFKKPQEELKKMMQDQNDTLKEELHKK